MSDSTTLTRCPHCHTRFRVSEQQLGIASGKVRCGNCMEVFDARAHSEQPGEAPAAPAPAPEPPPTSTSARQPAAPADQGDKPDAAPEVDDFLFQDDPEEDATDRNYTRSISDDELSDSFLALNQGGALDKEHTEEEQFEEVDESWAEAMLEEDNGRGPQPEPEPEPFQERPAPEPEPTRAPPRQPEAPLKATPAGPATDRPDAMSLSLESDEIRAPRPASRPGKGASPRPPWSDLRHQPISARAKPARRRSSTWLWALGCLALIALLLSQLYYFQFDRLSRVEPLRPLYAATCPWVGCQLPVMVDIDQIESRRLVVRSHPDEPQALLVEASVVNEAPFEQPFPAIVLTFSNFNNDIVAQRAFQPDEYLAGEARDLSLMAPDTPIKIALELRDPGQDAINYDLRFLPARESNQARNRSGEGLSP